MASNNNKEVKDIWATNDGKDPYDCDYIVKYTYKSATWWCSYYDKKNDIVYCIADLNMGCRSQGSIFMKQLINIGAKRVKNYKKQTYKEVMAN